MFQKIVSLPEREKFIQFLLNGVSGSPKKENSLQLQLLKGFTYLNDSCRTTKGFQGFIGGDKTLTISREAPTECFSSMVILDLLGDSSWLDDQVKKDLLQFLVKHPRENSAYYFFDTKKQMLPPDVDCTALGWAVILKNRTDPLYKDLKPLVRQKILSNVIQSNDNNNGIIQVYFPFKESNSREEREGRLDPVVCANAIYFLSLTGSLEGAEKTLKYLLQEVTSPDAKWKTEGSRYYPSPDVALYFITRSMLTSQNFMSEKIYSQFQKALTDIWKERILVKTTSTLDLSARLITGIQLELYIENSSEKSAMDTMLIPLMKPQEQDGGWKKEALFRCGRDAYYFGSRELTTAFALTALEKISQERC